MEVPGMVDVTHMYVALRGGYTFSSAETWQTGLRFLLVSDAGTPTNIGDLPPFTVVDETIARIETDWTIIGDWSAHFGLGSDDREAARNLTSPGPGRSLSGGQLRPYAHRTRDTPARHAGTFKIERLGSTERAGGECPSILETLFCNREAISAGFQDRPGSIKRGSGNGRRHAHVRRTPR